MNIRNLLIEGFNLLLEIERNVVLKEPRVEPMGAGLLVSEPLGKANLEYAQRLVMEFESSIELYIRRLRGEDVALSAYPPLCYLAHLNPTATLLHYLTIALTCINKDTAQYLAKIANCAVEELDLAIERLQGIYSQETIDLMKRLRNIVAKIMKELEKLAS